MTITKENGQPSAQPDHIAGAGKVIDAQPEGMVAGDWVMVPRVPTEAMLDAHWRQTGESKEMRARTHAYMRRYWSAMLAATPPAPLRADAGEVAKVRDDLSAIPETRVPLIGRAVRQSMRSYGHKVAESSLPECIAADVEASLRTMRTTSTPSSQGEEAAPRQGEGEAIERAADFLDQYAAFIRDEVKASDLERHPYLPAIEAVVADLRALPPASSAPEGEIAKLREALDWALAEIDGRTRYDPNCTYNAREQRLNSLSLARAALKGDADHE